MQHRVDGIDVDWENVSLTSKAEQKGVSKLMRQLKNQLPSGSCVSNAVPATPFYWDQFPSAEAWNKSVDWSVVMGYDLYGTFGPFTELASNLYEQKKAKVPDEDYHYNYPESVSVAKAVVHYKNQGLPTSKIILGVPFYCHSYYTDSNIDGGYRQRVYDANISSQIPFKEASGVWERGKKAHFNDGSAYSLSKLNGTKGTAKYQFLSCETPNSIANKVKFAKHEKLAGMSMWELSQDVNYEDSNSLLRAMTK
ncbi:glycoside hydrolase family 18 protein [Shewanella sp. 202IG2-18]|uniref:glycosyl hydrolase family 18 protein n=1 Tax=Parashewanella hymeniacidonis TaxID=2807618 RepID=UPI00195F7E3C|nr:glycoside hydrolase family 18 protein [Parashewanella hymeniacidonis]MBM7073943.1 glycoside hydrolase family 18 protein [Parashewanella hymeniacidonis]